MNVALKLKFLQRNTILFSRHQFIKFHPGEQALVFIAFDGENIIRLYLDLILIFNIHQFFNHFKVFLSAFIHHIRDQSVCTLPLQFIIVQVCVHMIRSGPQRYGSFRIYQAPY
jgi:hypothetical protein